MRLASVFSESRLRFYGWVIAVLSAVSFLGYFRAGAWLIDAKGLPMQTDFFTIWSASYQVGHGAPALAYDLATMQHIWSETFHGASQYAAVALPYPPPALLALAPLGLISYVSAAIIWIVIGFGLYLATIASIVPRSAALAVASAAPAAWWNAFTLQSGFVTAALIGLCLALLERRKIASGVMLGLLILKPQLGILFPIVLIAAGEGTVVASAIVTLIVLVSASTAAFGSDIWIGFYRAMTEAGNLNLGEGVGGWSRIESVYGFVRSIGGSAGLAWTCHAAVAAMVGVSVCWLWRREEISHSVRAAALSLAVFVVTPYLHGYDLVGLAIPCAFLVRAALESEFLPGERFILAGLFVGSALFVVLGQPFPFGPLLAGALGTCIALRALSKGRPAAKAPSKSTGKAMKPV